MKKKQSYTPQILTKKCTYRKGLRKVVKTQYSNFTTYIISITNAIVRKLQLNSNFDKLSRVF